MASYVDTGSKKSKKSSSVVSGYLKKLEDRKKWEAKNPPSNLEFNGKDTTKSSDPAAAVQKFDKNSKTPSYGKGLAGALNKVRDVLDANTEQDRAKRAQQSGKDETYAQEQTRKGNKGYANNVGEGLVKGIVGSTSNLIKTATDAERAALGANRAAGALEKQGKMSLKDRLAGATMNVLGQAINPLHNVQAGYQQARGYLEGDKAKPQDIIDQTNKDLNKNLDSRGFAGSTSVVDSKKASNLSVGDIAKTSFGSGVASGVELAPMGKGFGLATSLEGLSGKELAAQLAKNAALDAGMGSAYEAGNELSSGKGLDAKNIAISGALNAAGGLAGYQAGKVAKGFKDVGTEAISTAVSKATTKAGTKFDNIALPYIENSAISKAQRKASQSVSKAASSLGDTFREMPGMSKVMAAKDKFGEFVSDDAGILRQARKLELNGKAPQGFEQGTREMLKEIRAAPNIGARKLQANESFAALQGLYKDIKPKEYKQLGQAVNDMMELNHIQAGKRDVGVDSKVYAELKDRLAKNPMLQKASEAFPHINQLYRDRADELGREGIITSDMADIFGSNDKYIRLQKDQSSKVLKPAAGGSTFGSTRTVDKKLKGAVQADKNLDPMQTLFNYYMKTEQEMKANNFKKNFIGGMADSGTVNLARNTENVIKRQDIYKELKASKPLRDELSQMVKGHTATIKQLEKDVAGLNEAGLKKIGLKTDDIRNYMVKASNDGNLPGNGSKLAKLVQDPEKLLNEYINSDKNGFKGMLDKLAEKNDRIANMRNDLETVTNRLTAVATDRKNKMWEAKLLADDPTSGEKFVSFYDKGVKNFADMSVSPDLLKSFKQMSNGQVNDIVRAAQKVTRAFVTGQTGINYAFAPVNTLRDQASSAINSPDLFATHNPKQFLEAMGRSFAGEIFGKENKTYAAYKDFGGGQTIINSIEELSPMKRAEIKSTLGAKRSLGEKATTSVRELAEKPTGFSENLTRNQVYQGMYNKALRKLGDEEKAARLAFLASRESSVDFQDTSHYLRAINSFVPYFSSAAQGSRQLVRSFRDRPVTTAMKVMALVGAPMALSTHWNLSDENRRNIYDLMPQYQKKDNFVLITPGASVDDKGKIKGVILVPKPQGFSDLMEGMRSAMEQQWGSQSARSLGDAIKQGTTAVTTIDPSLQGVVNRAMPQGIKGVTQGYLNRDLYTNQPIVPENMSGLDPSMQVRDTTSGTARQIGARLGISPLIVEKFIKDTLGETGVVGMNTVDHAQALANPNHVIGGRDLGASVERRFTGATNNESNDFYQPYTKLENTRNYYYPKIKKALDAGEVNKAEKLSSEWDQMIQNRMSSYMQQYQGNPYAQDRMSQLEYLRIPVSGGKIRRYQSSKK